MKTSTLTEYAATTNLSLREGSADAAKKVLSQKKGWRFSERGIAFRLFLTCWIVFSLHFATNTVREIYPALSLGDHLSFDVSEYVGLHPDIFEVEGRKGAFINNNPGASMLGAIPYTMFRPVTDRLVERVQEKRAAQPAIDEAPNFDTIYPLAQEFYRKSRERGLDVKFGLAAAVTQAFCMAVISALSVVVMFYLLLSVTSNTRASLLLALLYAFATPVLYRTAQLNQNLLVAHFALFAFALLWRPSIGSKEQGKPLYFLAGLFCGWTVVLDYSGLVAVFALSLYALSRWLSTPEKERSVKDLFQYGAGVGICAVVLMAYQWSSFGNPFYPAQHYMPPATFSEQGYNGFSFPKLDLLWQTAFGMRFGLFTSAPLLLLVFYVSGWLRKEKRLLGRREIILIVSFTSLFFIFCAANQFGRMQFNTGVRHIVPVVPFVFLLAANVLLKLPRYFSIPFCVVATYWSWSLAMYRDVEQGYGIFESLRHITLEGPRLPWLMTLERMGYVSHNTFVIPLFLICAISIWALWRIGAQKSKTTA